MESSFSGSDLDLKRDAAQEPPPSLVGSVSVLRHVLLDDRLDTERHELDK